MMMMVCVLQNAPFHRGGGEDDDVDDDEEEEDDDDDGDDDDDDDESVCVLTVPACFTRPHGMFLVV